MLSEWVLECSCVDGFNHIRHTVEEKRPHNFTFMGSLSGFKSSSNNTTAKQSQRLPLESGRIPSFSIGMQILWIVNDNLEISERWTEHKYWAKSLCPSEPTHGMIWHFRVNLLGKVPKEASVRMTTTYSRFGGNTVSEKSLLLRWFDYWALNNEHDGAQRIEVLIKAMTYPEWKMRTFLLFSVSQFSAHLNENPINLRLNTSRINTDAWHLTLCRD